MRIRRTWTVHNLHMRARGAGARTREARRIGGGAGEADMINVAPANCVEKHEPPPAQPPLISVFTRVQF